MTWFEAFLVRYPELALFLVISLGAWFGGIRLGRFSIGPVTGSLFAGILVGQFAHVPVPDMTKSFLFLLFLFGIGYSVGPQFMQALRRQGAKPMLLAVICCATGLAAATMVAKLMGLDVGFAAGLVSGALTQSPAIGTATEAIGLLPLPEAERARLIAHVAVAHAVCYVFGSVGVIMFCSVVGPQILGIDLKTEARKLEQELGMKRAAPGVFSAWRRFEVRAYRLSADSALAGLSVATAEAHASQHRFFILRVRHDKQLHEATPDLVLHAGDVVALSGRREELIGMLGEKAEEVEDPVLLDIPLSVARVLLTSHDLVGRPLGELAFQESARGLYLRSVMRGGEAVPLAPGLTLENGDILHLVGPEPVVAGAARRMGRIIASATATDFVTLGLAIFLGGLAGALVTFSIEGMQVSLGTSVGTLLAGLLVGYLRTRLPLLGPIPDGAVALMTSLGLAAFVGMTGLQAGPVFLSAVAEAGVGLLLGGAVVTMAPMVVGLYSGRNLLRMNPLLLLGALAGAQTTTAAMAAVQEQSESPVAVLGYTAAVPIGQILLTTWGTVIVGLVSS
ncbi:aspartate-alanine antiporter-like transporter [Teichococcus oryzae]|uniref:Aspartate-alanine antiporter n=1 Tax=Teichococcus oryzae TaxID=1608942 RepID=A0A5B2TE94_9PROT|nr:TrkA C-terminal domain-containing protein [Pseudoroseomonas oryzae]KAA2212836.1 aspartate-alanine antiporter [Pseudoroseomonas oryzae]